MKQLNNAEAKIVDESAERVMKLFDDEMESLQDDLQFGLGISMIDKILTGFARKDALKLIDGLKQITKQRRG